MKVRMILPALTEATSPLFRPIKYSLFPPLGLATLAAYLDKEFEAGKTYHADKADWLDGKWSGIAPEHEELRGAPYDLALDEVVRRSREAWDRGEREQFLVSPVEGEAIRYTEGTEVGVKR